MDNSCIVPNLFPNVFFLKPSCLGSFRYLGVVSSFFLYRVAFGLANHDDDNADDNDESDDITEAWRSQEL